MNFNDTDPLSENVIDRTNDPKPPVILPWSDYTRPPRLNNWRQVPSMVNAPEPPTGFGLPNDEALMQSIAEQRNNPGEMNAFGSNESFLAALKHAITKTIPNSFRLPRQY